MPLDRNANLMQKVQFVNGDTVNPWVFDALKALSEAGYDDLFYSRKFVAGILTLNREKDPELAFAAWYGSMIQAALLKAKEDRNNMALKYFDERHRSGRLLVSAMYDPGAEPYMRLIDSWYTKSLSEAVLAFVDVFDGDRFHHVPSIMVTHSINNAPVTAPQLTAYQNVRYLSLTKGAERDTHGRD